MTDRALARTRVSGGTLGFPPVSPPASGLTVKNFSTSLVSIKSSEEL